MRYLSGIQPSGAPHIGNYFGMMRPALELQDKGEAFYFIADYHALTSLEDYSGLKQRTMEAAMAFLACGLDPERTVLWKQSAIPEVHELAWLLSIVTPKGLLERCHSYKDKTAKGIDATHGLFAYPVLMAADILLFNADAVPVGKDQKQHLEVTRDIAYKFNDRVGKEVFRIPEPEIRDDVSTIPGTDGEKMSKSYGNTLEIFGPAGAFKKKVMGIKTDSTPVEDPKPTEESLLLDYFALVATSQELENYKVRFETGGTGYGDLKKSLLEKLNAYFAPFRDKYADLEKRPNDVEDILQAGAARARRVAGKMLQKARKAMGIG